MQKMIRFLLAFLFIIWLNSTHLFAQPPLKPSIGLDAPPGDEDSICPIPLAIDLTYLFDEAGLQENDTIPDFKLYTLSNDSIHIGEVLTDGKPVLLIGGSYTCPKYRNHLNDLNDLQAAYGNEIHIYIVYTVEAHPANPDISPYRGNVWELTTNINKGIIYHEPVTYLDRKNATTDMLSDLDIQVPVLLDGPCNAWWQAFAMAPNPAFLIHPNGTIYKKQAWFDNGLYAMSHAIDSLLQELLSGVHEVTNRGSVINDPSSPVIQFIFPEPQVNARLMLFDAMGRMAKPSEVFSGNSLTVQKEHFTPGIYLYSIYGDKQVLNGKFLVQ